MEFNNYFPGQFIESTDLNFDNESHREELAQRFNVALDVPGVASGYKDGLGVIPGSLPDSITLLAGIAFDFNGKVIEILDEDENRINIPFENIAGQTYFVKAKYKQLQINPEYDPETGIGPDPQNPEIPYFTRVKDYYEIDISTTAPELLEVELARVIGAGGGNIVPSTLIDISQRKLASIKNSFLTNIDHTTLKNIGTLTHDQIDQRINQLFADVGLVPTSDGSPSLSLPIIELIGNIYDHDHSGEGQGKRIDHNNLVNVHPDQHHKKFHTHSLNPGEGDPDSSDGYVTKINLSDNTTEPIEVRGKLSGSYVQDLTLSDIHIANNAAIDQDKVDKSDFYEDNFSGTPNNLEQDLNQIRTEIKYIKFGHDPLKRFTDPLNANLEDVSEATTDKFDNPNGHKHTGVDGDGPQLTDASIVSKSLTKNSIANNTIDNDLVNANAGIKESKLDLEPSYAWRNYVISGAGIASFSSNTLNLVEPLVIYNVNCDESVNVITSSPLTANPGDAIYVDWPDNHDNSNDLELQSSNGTQFQVTASTVVLGYVNSNDNKLYVNWGHNPFHRHTGAPGDYQQLDINASTTGTLAESRIDSAIARVTYVDTSILAHNISNTAHPDLRAWADPATSPYVQKAGDTMSGNLTFLNNKRLVFKNTANQSIHFNRPNSSPSSEAVLQLALGTSASTNPQLQIGQVISSSFTNRLELHGDSGLIHTVGNVDSDARVVGNDLQTRSGIIIGKNNFRISDNLTTGLGTQLVLNPTLDFAAGTKIEGTLHSNKIEIDDQVVEKDNSLNGVAFDNIVSANDFYIRGINRSAVSLIAEIADRGFRKEKKQSTVAYDITLAAMPAQKSTSILVHDRVADITKPALIEDLDYTVSGNVITFIKINTRPSLTDDDIYVQYVVDPQVTPSLIVTVITPNHGVQAGGNSITLLGYKLDEVIDVQFDGISGTGLVNNSIHQLTVTVPAGASIGKVDVTVFTLSSSYTVSDGYEYE